MRVFLDTNVLVSAFATRGLCADVLREVLAAHELVVSRPLLSELDQVLKKKLKMPTRLVSEVVEFLKQERPLYDAGTLPRVKIKDRSDLRILSSALKGETDIFVTGDKELVALGQVEGIQILSPRTFWEMLKKS